MTANKYRLPKICIFAIVIAGTVAGSARLFWPPPSQVTRQNFCRLRPGMTPAEVEAIFGESGEVWRYCVSDDGSDHVMRWEGTGIAYVKFSFDTGLYAKQWHESGFVSETRGKLSRITVGMTMREVLAIIGRPPEPSGDYADSGPNCKHWSDIDGDGVVSFEAGRVVASGWVSWWRDFDGRQNPGFIDRLTDLLR